MIYKRVGSEIFPVSVCEEEHKRDTAEVLRVKVRDSNKVPMQFTFVEVEILEEALNLYLTQHSEGGKDNG